GGPPRLAAAAPRARLASRAAGTGGRGTRGLDGPPRRPKPRRGGLRSPARSPALSRGPPLTRRGRGPPAPPSGPPAPPAPRRRPPAPGPRGGPTPPPPAPARPLSNTTASRLSWLSWLRPTVSDPPPRGRRNPCDQPATGAAAGASGCPLSAADQPPAGSASTS